MVMYDFGVGMGSEGPAFEYKKHGWFYSSKPIVVALMLINWIHSPLYNASFRTPTSFLPYYRGMGNSTL